MEKLNTEILKLERKKSDLFKKNQNIHAKKIHQRLTKQQKVYVKAAKQMFKQEHGPGFVLETWGPILQKFSQHIDDIQWMSYNEFTDEQDNMLQSDRYPQLLAITANKKNVLSIIGNNNFKYVKFIIDKNFFDSLNKDRTKDIVYKEIVLHICLMFAYLKRKFLVKDKDDYKSAEKRWILEDMIQVIYSCAIDINIHHHMSAYW